MIWSFDGQTERELKGEQEVLVNKWISIRCHTQITNVYVFIETIKEREKKLPVIGTH